MPEELSISEAAGGLQSAFALVDLMTQSNKGGAVFTEFLVLRKENIKLKMYQEKGHYRPHLHVDYGRDNHTASYSIDDAQRLEGQLPSKYDQYVTQWIHKHREKLEELWHTAQAGKPVDKLITAIKNA